MSKAQTLCVMTKSEQGGPYFYYYDASAWGHVKTFVDNVHNRIGGEIISVKAYAEHKDDPAFIHAKPVQEWTAEEFLND